MSLLIPALLPRRVVRLFATTCCFLPLSSAAISVPGVLDLSGTWQFQLDK